MHLRPPPSFALDGETVLLLLLSLLRSHGKIQNARKFARSNAFLEIVTCSANHRLSLNRPKDDRQAHIMSRVVEEDGRSRKRCKRAHVYLRMGERVVITSQLRGCHISIAQGLLVGRYYHLEAPPLLREYFLSCRCCIPAPTKTINRGRGERE